MQFQTARIVHFGTASDTRSTISLGAAKSLPSECLTHRLHEIVLGDTCQNATRKIAFTVVVGQTSSELIGVVSLSLIPASLPGPLALQPSFQLPSFS